jgi:hypothetical protein
VRESLHIRWDAWFFLLFGVGFLVTAVVLGGTFGYIIGVLNLVNAGLRFSGIQDRGLERRRERLEAKCAAQVIPPQPDDLPRWFSPDNPPGWYVNPATDEPAYWSELGWRYSRST